MISYETMNIANTILEFAKESSKSGFLILDSMCNKDSCNNNKLLELVLGFVIDGMHQDNIKHLTDNYIFSGKYTGDRLIQARIIVDGMLGIQSGITIEEIAELICSHLDIEDRNSFIEAVKIDIRKLG